MTIPSEFQIAWRGTLGGAEIRDLIEDAWVHPAHDPSLVNRLESHSLGWVTARDGDTTLVGFVNVAWDGGAHAFLLDTTVATRYQHHGLGRQLVQVAIDGSRRARCRWLHVDFEPELRAFYFGACGFTPTVAGLIDLMSMPSR
jgi:hypothetical protein